jgi:hypothetical protein
LRKTQSPALYGIVAQFDTPEDILRAAKTVKDAGYTKVEGYTPYMVDGLVDILKTRDDRVTWIVFWAGMIGASLGFLMQYWINVQDFPMNIGGRPDLSWEAFIPVTFECGILSAALVGLAGMLGLNGLPQPNHPIFEAPGIEHVTRDKFLLCIESTDPKFDEAAIRSLFESEGAEAINEVRPE